MEATLWHQNMPLVIFTHPRISNSLAAGYALDVRDEGYFRAYVEVLVAAIVAIQT